MSSLGSMVSKSIKPEVRNTMVQLERKVLDDDNDNFMAESSKSGLDLTVSNHADIQKDSLIF